MSDSRITPPGRIAFQSGIATLSVSWTSPPPYSLTTSSRRKQFMGLLWATTTRRLTTFRQHWRYSQPRGFLSSHNQPFERSEVPASQPYFNGARRMIGQSSRRIIAAFWAPESSKQSQAHLSPLKIRGAGHRSLALQPGSGRIPYNHATKSVYDVNTLC